MRTRRPAVLPVLALLLALLLPHFAPRTSAHAGTPSARLTAAVQDAVPAARPAVRHHLDSGVLTDGLVPGPVWQAPDQQEPPPAGTPRLLSGAATGAVRARGPPQV